MGFRLRKSLKIMPGVKMNVSTSGMGYFIGGKGYRVTKHADGRVTRTVGLPGTGLSHTRTPSGGRSSGSVNLAVNRKDAARKDVQIVLVEDPSYPGLTEALLALPA